MANDSDGFASHLNRLTFRLAIPTDVTPSTALKAGPEGSQGGVSWALQVHFLMRKRWARHHRSTSSVQGRPGGQPSPSHDNKHSDKHTDRTEVVHCTIPVNIYPGERNIEAAEQILEVSGR